MVTKLNGNSTIEEIEKAIKKHRCKTDENTKMYLFLSIVVNGEITLTGTGKNCKIS